MPFLTSGKGFTYVVLPQLFDLEYSHMYYNITFTSMFIWYFKIKLN